MIALYNYQRDAVDSIYRYFADNAGNPLIVIPTAGGKSLVVAEFLREIFEQWPDQRGDMIVERKSGQAVPRTPRRGR